MRHRLALAAILALIGACATTADGPRTDQVASIRLHAGQRNVGESGTALMTSQGNGTSITLIVGVPSWVVRPVQLYVYIYAGSCLSHDAKPAHALNDVVQAAVFGASPATGPYTLKKFAPLPMASLRAGAYALVVRASPADGDVELYCGESSQSVSDP
jgi:hypothetical protein